MARYQRQRGAALYIVLIVIMMTILLAIYAARTALFHEVLTGNEADYQKTFEAAMTLMQDAEMDILQIQASGTACQSDESNGDICRRTTNLHFPSDKAELADLLLFLDTLPTGCLKGICRKRSGIQDFWSDPQLLLQMTASDNGARYGQFTGAGSGAGGNAVLSIRSDVSRASDMKGAWYWVEVLPFVDASVGLLSSYESNGHTKAYAPDKSKPWIYRITVFARGQKKGSEVLLQSVLSLQSSE